MTSLALFIIVGCKSANDDHFSPCVIVAFVIRVMTDDEVKRKKRK